MRVVISPQARSVLENAMVRFEDQSMGSQFRYDVTGYVDLIKIHPDLFPANDQGIRKVRLSEEFPYDLNYIYFEEDEEIHVVSIARQMRSHGHQTALVAGQAMG